MDNELNYIIDQIDSTVKAGFYVKNSSFHGLVDLVDRNLNEDTVQTFPGKYVGNGEYKDAMIDDSVDMVVYHRNLGIDEEDDTGGGFGRNTMRTITYNQQMVVWINQDKVGGNKGDDKFKFIKEIKSLIPGTLTKVDLVNINARNGMIKKGSTNTEKRTLFDQEHENVDYKIKPEHAYFSIEYTIELKRVSDCVDVSCEPKKPWCDVSKLSCENLMDPNFGITPEQLVDCSIGIECPKSLFLKGVFASDNDQM